MTILLSESRDALRVTEEEAQRSQLTIAELGKQLESSHSAREQNLLNNLSNKK